MKRRHAPNEKEKERRKKRKGDMKGENQAIYIIEKFTSTRKP